MNRHELKIAIKQTFGTMARFARIAGIDRLKLWDIIAGRNTDRYSLIQAEETFNRFKSLSSVETVTIETRKKIDLQIFTHFKTRSRLVRAYPQFNDPFISNLINGKIQYHSKRVDKLVEILDKLDCKQKND